MKFTSSSLLLAFLGAFSGCEAFTTTTNAASATRTQNLSMAAAGGDAHQALLDKAAQIRAEIAALEGKTVEQVEQEARDKKQLAIDTAAEQQKAKELAEQATPTNKHPKAAGSMLTVPSSPDEMIQQAARAMEAAYQDGVKRQTVRLALVREEDPSMMEINQWPGGAQQMYREAAKPLTQGLLRELRLGTNNNQGLLPRPPVVTDQDIWDFDGSALITSTPKEVTAPDGEGEASSHPSAIAMVFPNTDVKYINDIDSLNQEHKDDDDLFFLVNPFWRNIESWGINLLAPGAKKKAQKIIFDDNDNSGGGYEETYHFLRFSARGEECVAIKAYPYDWQLFAYIEDETMGWQVPVRLGSCEEEPKSELITELLNGRPEFKLSKTMRQMRR